jgi:hypothetical protein
MIHKDIRNHILALRIALFLRPVSVIFCYFSQYSGEANVGIVWNRKKGGQSEDAVRTTTCSKFKGFVDNLVSVRD